MATVHYGRLIGPEGFSRTVAIKCLHPQFAQDPDFVTMFLDEARMAARIRHPNVVPTLDVVNHENEIFLVMDYVHGESLGRLVRDLYRRGQTVPLPIVLRIGTDILQGLHAAHEARDEQGAPLHLVHRDVSPQNVLLGIDGVARLSDFGVAKAGGRAQTTREGHIKGKLGYMAPEQLRSQPVTRQADIHSFAIVLWEMVAGRRLFSGDTEADVFAAVMRHEVPLLSRLLAVPAALDDVVGRGMNANLQHRYATARDMAIELGRCGPVAQTLEVAEWAEEQMKDLLVPRDRMVSIMEREQSSINRSLASGVMSSGWMESRAAFPAEAAPDDDDDLNEATVHDSSDEDATIPATDVPAAVAALLAERGTQPEAPAPPLPPPRKNRVWAAGLVGGALLVVAAVWAVRASTSTPPVGAKPATPSPPEPERAEAASTESPIAAEPPATSQAATQPSATPQPSSASPVRAQPRLQHPPHPQPKPRPRS
jgi:serine/threonine protein kinase